jgi:hypothetical protein
MFPENEKMKSMLHVVVVIIVIFIVIAVIVALFRRGGRGRGGGRGGHGGSKHHHSFSTVLVNQAAVTNGDNVLWAETPNQNLVSGISIDNLGNVTLPNGKYLIASKVRLTRTPFDGTSVATIQLQQTLGGTATNVNQPTINTDTAVDGITDAVPQRSAFLSSSAVITVTDSTNNVINLLVSLGDAAVTIPSTSGADANAELVIQKL